VRVAAVAEEDDRAVAVGVVAEDDRAVVVAAVAAVEEEGTEIAEIAAVVVAETVAGKHLQQIRFATKPGSIDAPRFCFLARCPIVSESKIVYAFPRRGLWLPYTSKTYPTSSIKRSATAPKPAVVP
jgi:hypothetical protein